MDPHRPTTSSVILLIGLLSGCAGSYFVPMELAPSRIQTTHLGSEPSDGPTLHVLTHAAGLGWQLQARQEWIDREQVAEQEYWKGFTYRSADSTGRQIALTAGTAISCPGSVLDHLVIRTSRLMGLLDGPEPTLAPHQSLLCRAVARPRSRDRNS
jgi:hypothetical protein